VKKSKRIKLLEQRLAAIERCLVQHGWMTDLQANSREALKEWAKDDIYTNTIELLNAKPSDYEFPFKAKPKHGN
jgi:hypothetical protein